MSVELVHTLSTLGAGGIEEVVLIEDAACSTDSIPRLGGGVPRGGRAAGRSCSGTLGVVVLILQ